GVALFEIFQDDADVVGIQNALAAADGAAGGHDAGGAGILEPASHDRIVTGVDENLEALLDELLGGLQSGNGCGQQGLAVAQAFELDPIGAGIAPLASSSRASRAWRMASSALKHPAVLGKMV